MQHVDPKPAGFGDRLRMLSVMYEFLSERDRVRPVKFDEFGGVQELETKPCRGGEG
jgi:hypothetical protein